MGGELLSKNNSIQVIDSDNLYSGKAITETISYGLFKVDQQLTVKYWNKAAANLLGIQAKDIIGKNLRENFLDDIPPNFSIVCEKAFLEDNPIHSVEYWAERGAWFDVITYHCEDTLSVSFKSRNPFLNPEDPAQQLKTLNELYKFVTEITNDCLWEWDLQSKELFWIDGGHKRVFGYQVENALIPQSFWESLIHPDDKVRILSGLNKIIDDESISTWEDNYRFRKSNGDYAYVHDRGRIINDENGKASRMIGATQDITQKVLLENKLADERLTRQREITAAVLTAQENERSEIGKELHDNLNQVLAVAKMYMHLAKTNEENREIHLEKSAAFIVNVIDEIRRISKNLVIPGIHIISLSQNIKNLLHDLHKIYPIKIDFLFKRIKDTDLNEKHQLSIFRIIQEQLNNILKHSKASRATIHLSRLRDEIILIISDNGVGCDILKENNGVGIINIKSRVELLNGNVRITSSPKKGFELKVSVPMS
jgi:PAS domain S-box-containing protein